MDTTKHLPAKIDWPAREEDEPRLPGTEEVPEFADIPGFAPSEPAGSWTPRHTRRAGLAVGTLALLVCLAAVVRAGSANLAFVLAALGLAVAAALTHGLRDAGAGAVYASTGLTCAFFGGALLPGNHLLLAGASLLIAALLGLVTAAGATAPLVTGVTVGLFALSFTIAAASLPAPEAAAVPAAAGLMALVWLERWAGALARIPLRVAGLAKTRRPWAKVVRADGLVTGMTVGIAVVAVPCQVALAREASVPALALIAVLAAGLLLRACGHHTLVRRLALLVAGATGVVLLAGGPALTGGRGVLAYAGPGLVGLVALVVLAALLHALRTPKARNWLLAEVVPLVAVVPAAYAVLAG